MAPPAQSRPEGHALGSPSPFHVHGPAVVSVSGGRTSAYLLRRILDAHGGSLPPDVVACFCNTGREADGTLDFVREIGERWGVPIAWLEYRHEPGRPYFAVVDHATASRAGEPFDALLRAKRIVPDPTRRFCTGELKVATLKRHLKSLEWRRWTNVVGLRADESVRLERRAKAEANPKFREPWRSVFPLAAAGIQEMDVARFWREQPFDLRLPSRDHGNCVGCFLKSSEALGRLFRSDPEHMDWWTAAEAGCRGKTFVHGRSYAEIGRVARNQGTLDWDDSRSCDGGCGV